MCLSTQYIYISQYIYIYIHIYINEYVFGEFKFALRDWDSEGPCHV